MVCWYQRENNVPAVGAPALSRGPRRITCCLQNKLNKANRLVETSAQYSKNRRPRITHEPASGLSLETVYCPVFLFFSFFSSLASFTHSIAKYI